MKLGGHSKTYEQDCPHTFGRALSHCHFSALHISKHHEKPPMQQYFVKSYQELSVLLHSCLSLFVFLQTAIGCWTPSDDCNRRGKSRRNAVQPLCLSYSLILLTLSLCCGRQDKQTGHSCSIRHRPTAGRHFGLPTWRISKKHKNHRQPRSQKNERRMDPFHRNIPD